MEYASRSEEETQKIAADLAASLIEKGQGDPIVIALEGELGAGKTVFAKGFSRALGVEEEIKSPTFVLMKTYQIVHHDPYRFLFHLDCYRLRDEEDLVSLGIEEIMNQKGNVILIEWSDRVKKVLPSKKMTVHIDHVTEQNRNIHIS